ncbi:hypothetical protein P3342_007054 [Pyrenophora teres f. teres]|uniref:Uncharacterized protein n=1 Tax=Pyrenophora teres f. teres TaxID=97479 RepID=A0A6S6W4T7_9PLEO|nr:hypothetical protein P3342_007054 [Pyrenophora teres f. teres]CAE7033337.1 hypothetical protein PTTW11_05191 [Pyrenophora teres f. teres]
MPAMSSSPNPITNLPLLLPIANGNNRPNHLMPWNTGEYLVSKLTLLKEAVRVADAAGKYFDQDLARLGLGNRDFLDGPRRAEFL